MKTKVCTKCKIEKDAGDFHFRSKKRGILEPRCKPCRNKANREYAKTPHAKKAKKDAARKKMEERRIWYVNIKENTPCSDCGKKYPFYVMQFDHVPERGDKRSNISSLWRGHKEETILKEISKCELVCANCHAARSYKRINK